MNSILQWLENAVSSLPQPLLDVWGRVAFILGCALAVSAFGGFTFKPAGRWGLGRERQAWDAKAILSIPLTFILINLAGYLGSSIVLVPGAQTLESLKDLVVFLGVTLFGYPALLTVPFAYGLSDLIEGVPPAFLWDWLPGYFINPACFWVAYQLFGKDPDFKKPRTWALYLAFVALFMALEPMLWGYICSDKFTAAIAYRKISSALFFTTGLTWLMAPLAMLAALPLARRYGMFWAEIPGHVKERRWKAKDWAWTAGLGTGRSGRGASEEAWPIRMALLAPFIALVLVMTGATAYVTLRSAAEDANKLATRLHQEISANIDSQLDEQLPHLPKAQDQAAAIQSLLKSLPIARHGLAMVLDRSGKVLASSGAPGDPVALKALDGLRQAQEGIGDLDRGLQFQFDHVQEKPLSHSTWLAHAQAYPGRRRSGDRVVLTLMPESYYLAGVHEGNSRSAMVFALALLCSVAVAGLLASLMTSRLRRLALATRALADGDLSQRVPGSPLEELDALAGSFNDMAEQLSASMGILREKETFLRLAQDAAHVGSWEWDPRSNRVKWSEGMARMHGIKLADFDGKLDSVLAFYHPDSVQDVLGKMARVRSGEDVGEFDYRIRRRDGVEREILILGRTHHDERGAVNKVLGIAMDITERKRQDTLMAEETRVLSMIAAGHALPEVLDALVRSMQAVSKDTVASILLLDPDGRHLRHGAAPGLPEAYNKAVDGSAIGPKAGSCGTAAYRREAVLVTDIATDPLWDEYRHLALPHGLRACWSTPIKDADGKILGTFALYRREPRSPTAVDLELIERATHLAGVAIVRQRGEDKNRELVHDLGERVKELTCLHDAAGILQDESLSTAQWLDELVRIMPAGWQYPGDTAVRIRLDGLEAASPGFAETPWRQSAAFTDASGTRGLMEVVYLRERPPKAEGPFLAEERRLLDSLAELLRSAVDRRQSGAALRANEQHMREEKRFVDSLMDSLPGVVFLIDAKGTFLKWNQALERFSGFSRAEISQKGPIDFVPREQQELVRLSIEKVLTQGQDSIEVPLLTRDGQAYPYYLNGVRLVTEQGTCVLGVGIDISDRRRLEDQLRQAQKMEAVGALAGGIAHDFNNLLTVILGFSQLLKAGLEPADPRREDVDQIITTSERAASLTKQLLAFSRKQVLKPELLDLNQSLAEMQKMLQRVIGEDVSLQAQLAPSPVRCKADPSQLSQAVINLVVNARDAMPKGGKLTISTALVDLDEAYCRAHPQANPGPHARLSVSDTGAGMSPEVKARIFEPFFTTKGVGKGTGLGLAMVYGMMQQSGGHAVAESEPGQGATFHLYFPAATGPAEPAAAAPAPVAESSLRGEETVLLVEDEEALRDLGSRALKDYGYHVVLAAEGQEALGLLRQAGNGISIVVTDVVMPVMSGPALAEVLRQEQPSLPILFVSGHAEDAVLRHGLLFEEIELLNKPYSPLDLVKKVRHILDSPKAG